MAKVAYIGVGNFATRALPSGYTQVEYIESTGTQYIDTGFKPKYNTRIVMDISGLGSSTQWLFGARDTKASTAAKQFGVARVASGLRADYFGTNKTLSISDTTARSVVERNANVVNAFGQTVTNTAVSSGEVSYTMYLFSMNTVGALDTSMASFKMYSCQIYDNGALIRDYVPCTNSVGVAGLYDMANGVFYQNAGSGTFAVGTSTYASVARKINKGYVGVPTEVPIYEETVKTVNITASNISEMFTVANGTYYFKGSGGTFTTTNAGENSTTATTTLTAKSDMSVSFNYSYSSEANYDKFTLQVAGTTVENAVSGSTTSKSYSGSLKSGQQIVFTYAKDNSQSKNDDKCTFSNMVVTGAVRTQVGVETKSFARKIKKVYMGIDGVAHDVSFETPIGGLPVGTSVYLKESGKAVEYIIVHQGNPDTSTYDESCNGTWLMRKAIYSISAFYNTTWDISQYEGYALDTLMNTTVYGKFSATLKSAIRTAKIPYFDGTNKGTYMKLADGLPRNVFALSNYEVGFVESDRTESMRRIGSKLDYFQTGDSWYVGTPACDLRVAQYNGTATEWWLRSPCKHESYYADTVNKYGGSGIAMPSSELGARPALILKPDTNVPPDMIITGA